MPSTAKWVAVWRRPQPSGPQFGVVYGQVTCDDDFEFGGDDCEEVAFVIEDAREISDVGDEIATEGYDNCTQDPAVIQTSAGAIAAASMLELSGQQQLSTFQSPVTAAIPQLTAAENNGDHVSHGNEEVNEGDSERELIAVAHRVLFYPQHEELMRGFAKSLLRSLAGNNVIPVRVDAELKKKEARLRTDFSH
ncbi:hypothetical protein PR003_g30070, partial [Phytophthora rubi]